MTRGSETLTSCFLPRLALEHEIEPGRCGLHVRVAQGREPVGVVGTGVLLVADAYERRLEQPHDRGEHTLAVQTRTRKILPRPCGGCSEAPRRTRRGDRTSPRRETPAIARGSGTACGLGRRVRWPAGSRSPTRRSIRLPTRAGSRVPARGPSVAASRTGLPCASRSEIPARRDGGGNPVRRHRRAEADAALIVTSYAPALGTAQEVDDHHDQQDDDERSDTDVHAGLLGWLGRLSGG